MFRITLHRNERQFSSSHIFLGAQKTGHYLGEARAQYMDGGTITGVNWVELMGPR